LAVAKEPQYYKAMLREETLVAVRKNKRTSISNRKNRLVCGAEKKFEKRDFRGTVTRGQEFIYCMVGGTISRTAWG
jgi:hypothetical protein